MLRHKLTIVSFIVLSAALALSLTAAPKSGGQAKGDAAKGKEAFEACAICHNVDTDEKKMGPSLKGLFKHKTLASGKPVTDANVRAQINDGGNGMPPYGQQLTDDEKDNILAYLHTL